MRKQRIYSNWGTVYRATGLYSSKTSRSWKLCHPPKSKWLKDNFRLKEDKDTWQLNVTNYCELNSSLGKSLFSSFAMKNIPKTTGKISLRSINWIIVLYQCSFILIFELYLLNRMSLFSQKHTYIFRGKLVSWLQLIPKWLRVKKKIPTSIYECIFLLRENDKAKKVKLL